MTSSHATPLGQMPIEASGFTPDLVQSLVRTMHVDAVVQDVEVRRFWEWGNGHAVSTSGRVDLDVTYGAGTTGLPTQVVLKIARPQLPAHPLYRNEVEVYTKLRPFEFIRTPTCLGGWFDESTGTFALALEDLTSSGAVFASALRVLQIASIESLVRELAALHARFWGTRADWRAPQLSWAQSHVTGELHELFDHPDLVPAMISTEVATTQHKRELLQSAGLDAASLHRQVRAVQQHQATLTPTLVHGDSHIGNCFILPDGEMGLIDWQLSVRGHYMHDLSYVITTGLSVEDRRAHERRLIDLHLQELASHGVEDLPSSEEAFERHRQAQAWNTYIGWLTCPVENYGWEINVANHVRLLTAYRDLDSAAAIEAIA